MKTKYTPGPWSVVKHVHDADGAAYESFSIIEAGHEKNWESWTLAGLCHTTQDEANARLIAAAPELLEVLENCLGNINPERGFADELEEEIRAAIAKARGES